MFCFKGDRLQIEIFGASHSQEIGVIMKNFPEENIDRKKLDEFLQRRRPLYSFSTERKETDEPIFSEFTNDVLSENVKVVIKNSDIRSGDYNNLYGKPRPSHADYAAYLKDGRLDFSGGGEFSGRMTAPLCIAGGISKQLLENRGIYVGAYLSLVGDVNGKSYKNGEISLEEITSYRDFPSLTNSQEMIEEIGKAKKENDSVGGIVECVVKGMKKGVGGTLFDGLESEISQLLFAVPGVKGVEFGRGFSFAEERGSQVNDEIAIKDGKIYTKTNNSGGINGGVSNGEDITLAVAFRPTPSIGIKQNTADLVKMKNTEIVVSGRHDACIAVRAVPVVEAAVSIALLDKICADER